MLDQDLDLELPTDDELLVEIGLDSYTIRRILTEAVHADTGEGEELFIGGEPKGPEREALPPSITRCLPHPHAEGEPSWHSDSIALK